MKRFDKFAGHNASLAYYSPRDINYHISYHNQLWASLTNGLAATPVWWSYNQLSEEDWDQLQVLAGFVSDLDLAGQPYKPLSVSAEGVDLYVMGTPEDAFGWGRSYEKANISGIVITIPGMPEQEYTIVWVDPWTGKIMKTNTDKLQEGKLILEVPKMKEAHPDVVFKIVAKQELK